MDAKRIPIQIWIVSVSSMLITASAAMFFGVFGLFLESMGTSTDKIGLIEGIVEGAGYVLKVISGIISDYLSQRKLIFAIGALFSALSKVLATLFFSFSAVVIGRIIDRIGNGLQASPRDAFVCDHAPRQIIGTCFGIRQGMGTLGAILGVLLVFALLEHCHDDFRKVFTVASILALGAFVLIFTCLHDAKNPPAQQLSQQGEPRQGFSIRNVIKLDRRYWWLMVIVAIFMSCRISETLIMLYGKASFKLSNSVTEEIMLVYNVFSAIAAYGTGRLTDRIRASSLMLAGTIITMGSLFTMTIATHFVTYLVGVVLWGLQIGLMHNVFCSEVSKIVPPHYRGTGFSFYYLIIAVSLFISNTLCGRLMKSGYAFAYCVCISVISCISVVVFIKRHR
ncbi:MAG: MFS transporter [Holosporales bacterium]|jgi:predicted MFS family arabinose efflux permease|nr:MFS transporter [Holosporales bacterium]